MRIAAVAIMALGACTSFSATPSVDTDAGATDAGAADSGTADAPADGFVGRPCGADFIDFCDDFERDFLTPGPGWVTQGSGITPALDATTSDSPRRSLVIAVNGSPSSTGFLNHDLPATARKFRFVFALEVDAPIALTQVVSIRFVENKYLTVSVDNGQLVISEQDTSQPFYQAVSAGTAPMSWARYELSVDVGSAKLMTLSREGVEVARRPLVLTFGDVTSIRFGVTYTSSTTSANIHYDDVGILAQ